MPTDNGTQNTEADYGLLRVNVFLSNIGYPAKNVTVTITDSESGEIVEQLLTNSEGQIPPIRLPAPPLENSQSSTMPRPFSQYDVNAYLDGYDNSFIRNVQIYPESTAIQNISLVPLYDNIFIPYPTLWGSFPPKIPESELKKLPFPSNLSVLPEPVVPELIVVHAGVPEDRTAAEYTVGFKEYIKNVASSEIYANWPREALKANILAIISFTMNRVYTEWYRSKGFDFTVTNSTAYDQAFTYGRNVFQEISDIVDEVFNLYISRAGITQPLFTQYSDGIRVIRDGWLSQWGSKTLAEQGYSALQILKSYYGYDIVLREARRVEGIPISFPGVLDVGSRGNSVRALQEQLNAIANNYPLINKLIEDGIYGESTSAAVRTFQEIFDLPVTGIVNFPTWYKISDVFNAVTS